MTISDNKWDKDKEQKLEMINFCFRSKIFFFALVLYTYFFSVSKIIIITINEQGSMYSKISFSFFPFICFNRDLGSSIIISSHIHTQRIQAYYESRISSFHFNIAMFFTSLTTVIFFSFFFLFLLVFFARYAAAAMCACVCV